MVTFVNLILAVAKFRIILSLFVSYGIRKILYWQSFNNKC